MATTTGQDGTHRIFVSYIDKSRDYYRASGYDNPYRWASNDEAPFAPLPKPLSECRLGLVTTSFLHQDDKPPGSPPPLPKVAYTHPTDRVPPRMFTDDLSWHKEATHTDDVETFLPVRRLQELVERGRIGSLAPRFYGVPTEYSQRRTGDDAARIAEWCGQDEVDVVLLVPL